MSVLYNLDHSLKGQSSQAQALIIHNHLTTEPSWNVALIAYALALAKTEAMAQIMKQLQRQVFNESHPTIQTPSDPGQPIPPDGPQQSDNVSNAAKGPIEDQSDE